MNKLWKCFCWENGSVIEVFAASTFPLFSWSTIALLASDDSACITPLSSPIFVFLPPLSAAVINYVWLFVHYVKWNKSNGASELRRRASLIKRSQKKKKKKLRKVALPTFRGHDSALKKKELSLALSAGLGDGKSRRQPRRRWIPLSNFGEICSAHWFARKRPFGWKPLICA